jgi:hypothetical protein
VRGGQRLLNRLRCRGSDRRTAAAALLLVLGVPGLGGSGAAAQPPPPAGDFGRWESVLRDCRIEEPSGRQDFLSTWSCLALQLDQPLEGLLSLRFRAGGGPSERHLIFAGMLESGSRPLRCRQGDCQPTGALQVRVSAVASSHPASRGEALPLPRARLARGRCLLEERVVRCEAEGAEGEHWSARGRR